MTVAIFSKMANLRKWGIGQESIKGLAKPQMRCVTRREILTKGKFQQKWRGGAGGQKFIKRLAKYSNEMTKKGMLTIRTITNFARMANLARRYLQRDDKKGHLDKWRL